MIQQGWGAVLRWGGKLSQNLAELAARKEEMKTDLHHFQAGSDFAPVSSGAQVPWALGRLFGAPKSPNSPQGHSMPTRFAPKLTEKFAEGPKFLLLLVFFFVFLVVVLVLCPFSDPNASLHDHFSKYILNSSRRRNEECVCSETSFSSLQYG